VRASASQVESEEMRPANRRCLTFDAFLDLKLNARVSNIGHCGPGRDELFLQCPVYLTILDHDSRVIPDLTTSSDVVVNQVMLF
jgi:hypothetical protein